MITQEDLDRISNSADRWICGVCVGGTIYPREGKGKDGYIAGARDALEHERMQPRGLRRYLRSFRGWLKRVTCRHEFNHYVTIEGEDIDYGHFILPMVTTRNICRDCSAVLSQCSGADWGRIKP
jgi:hypothetical protein